VNYSHYILPKKYHVLKGLSCPIGLTTEGLVSLRTDYHSFHTELPNPSAFEAVRIYNSRLASPRLLQYDIILLKTGFHINN